MSHVYHPHRAGVSAECNTGVFWDVVDFPIPECDPDMISKKIKLALEDKGCYNGPVSIRLYEDEKNLLPKELIEKYESAGISINFVPEVAEAYIHARVHKMLVDILFWALDNPAHSNLIILSKNLKDKETVSNLQGLHSTGMNVLLAEPVSEELPFTESSAWLWESLSSDGGGSSQDTVAVYKLESKSEEEASV
ncbi:NYN domain limkain-b1-type [Arabidopsis thaliana x Arabidopsis arenosa]|uniref:NYN domain limkain-b1-type n=1 Tax=Arabidopsis thaliana x Arabidopsis arenosa TaxID=1240361 RepID=A0A8T1XUF4_9BRAS|nr:NYN domain limkain-b1-type [Arabidopsis thaliana x Arabidopsis arenosa]